MLTSPITHEKIIEVLRAIVEDRDATEAQFWGMPIPIRNSSIEAAHDLYQRLQAEKEGGEGGGALFRIGQRVRKIKGSSWQGHIVGTYATALTPEGYCVESEREPGSVQLYPASALEPIEPADDIDMATPELLRARPHVAPPASGNDGSGRPTEHDEARDIARRILDRCIDADEDIAVLARQLIRADEALASEYERGVAAGRRSGIETAAKMADAESRYVYGIGAQRACQKIAVSIRALNTGDAS